MKENKIFIVFLATVLISTLGFVGSRVYAQTRLADRTEDVQTKKTVKDELGREVVIPENPERILALTSAAMQALFNIEITPVGKVDNYKVSKEGMELPSVGTASSVSIESVYALKPDLIIASSRFHSAIEEELEKTGAVVYYFDPDKVGDIPVVEVTAYIGKLLGKDDIAREYVQSVFKIADELKEKIDFQTDIETGIVIQDGSTIVAAQNASSYGSMLTLLGIDNIVPDNLPNAKKSSFVPLNVESILASNPDIVLIMMSGKNTKNNKAILEKFKSDPQWAALDAVKKNRILILPFSVNPNRSTPEDMVQATAKAILKIAQKADAGTIESEKTIEDHIGRKVTIPENPERFLALQPSIMESLFCIGIKPVGKVDEYKIRKEGIALPSVGSHTNVNIEVVYQLQPDVIIGNTRYQSSILKSLEATGAAVIIVNPESLGERPLIDSVRYWGKVFDRTKNAKEYIEYITKIADKLKQKIERETDIKRVLILQDGDTILAAQKTTSYGSILSLLGLENIVPDDLPGSKNACLVSFDVEKIIQEDPDMIFVIASSNDPEQNKAIIQKFKNDSKWQGLTAVKNNKIVTLPFKVKMGRSSAEEMLRTTAKTILTANEK
ncbi:ABC transporter substrate-binding protein [Halocella sp. SP3-1]|uniref:ABC transporter substrate-binding protein n=1 Tax=Halocella sp. SP3-1 TaxID=2382161 RepID=UPI0013DFA823|nr:ABC transporter substrate-binding protein [Halocella sp. SP3-1]